MQISTQDDNSGGGDGDIGPRQIARPLLSLSGFLISTLGALCGIGGGLFSTPLVHFGFGFPLRRAVAVSLAVVATGTISATVSESLRANSDVQWSLVGVLVVSALVGNVLGFRLVHRIPIRTLKSIFVVLLILVGSKIIFASDHVVLLADADLSLLDHGRVVGLGLLAGVLVPLLGIGGGMVMVPGLLFLLPEIGYLGTRATSMAVAAVIASRSLLKYSREGLVDWRMARWLALGSLFGAWCGVWLVHIDGVASVAQITMGVVLWLSAARFAFDVCTSDSSD
ncbi:MAG: sulfite exporter TauE/SafE family protein [Planctomycetes bacterium]|nr:sulfite exporter TauE/SafE family protein [Planctomycetota bacterium]